MNEPFIFLLIVFMLHLFGNTSGFYKVPEYQKFVHLVGGLFFGSTGLYFGYNPLFFAVVGGVMWEVFEYLVATYSPIFARRVCWYSRSWSGAFSDVAMGVIGALLLVI